MKPYQPDGVWEAVAMIGSNTRDYQRDTGENLYRRSLYTFWKRAAPPASMDIFNAPSRETCTVRRERTNTPLQALVTLNDPQFVEAARHLAADALKRRRRRATKAGSTSSPGGCSPGRSEPRNCRSSSGSLDELLALLSRPRRRRQASCSPSASRSPTRRSMPPTLAAWTMLANELMNLDEVLNK